jgi:hypothetical protein
MGGASRSPEKKAAARENGLLGGRPPSPAGAVRRLLGHGDLGPADRLTDAVRPGQCWPQRLLDPERRFRKPVLIADETQLGKVRRELARRGLRATWCSGGEPPTFDLLVEPAAGAEERRPRRGK